jgi:hypothetical protein
MIPFVILLIGSYLFVSLPPLNGHAVDRHAGQAVRAWKHVKNNGGPGDRWDCPDGRIRWVCGLTDKEGKAKGLFAVVVIAATGGLITAFICNQSYAKSITDQGKNPWKLNHP